MRRYVFLGMAFLSLLYYSRAFAWEKNLAENEEDYAIGDNTRNPGYPAPVALGDINGDGYCDLILGAPHATALGQSDTGIVYIRFGLNFGSEPGQIAEDWFDLSTSASQSLDPTVSAVNFDDGHARLGGVQINGELPGCRFGASVATGDFDGDGTLDIAVSMAQDRAPAGPGRVYVLKGRPDIAGTVDLSLERSESRSFYIIGRENGDRFGQTLFFLDFNNDGKDDLIMGAPHSSGGGTVDVFYGRDFTPFFSQGVDSLPHPHTTFLAEGTSDELGQAFAGGDLTADGLLDLCIGAPGNSDYAPFSGKTYLLQGTFDLPFQRGTVDLGATTRTLALISRSDDEKSGSSLACGDFNSDGLPDLVIGAPGWGAPESLNRGRVYVLSGDGQRFKVLGSGALEISSAELRFSSLESESRFGTRIAFMNLDNRNGEDLVITAPYKNPSGRTHAGEAWIIQSRRQGNPFDKWNYHVEWYDLGVYITGQAAGDYMGSGLATGDFNGDNMRDVFFTGQAGINSSYKSAWGLFGSESYRRTSVPSMLWNLYK